MGSIIPETHCLRKHFFSICSDFFRWPLHCRRSGIPVSKSTPLMVSSSQKRRSSLLYREILWFTVCTHQAASSSFFPFLWLYYPYCHCEKVKFLDFSQFHTLSGQEASGFRSPPLIPAFFPPTYPHGASYLSRVFPGKNDDGHETDAGSGESRALFCGRSHAGLPVHVAGAKGRV